MLSQSERKISHRLRVIITIWLVNSAALLISDRIFSGVECKSIQIALVTGLVLSLLTYLIEPVLYLLTLPINMATFGLFTFVLNGIVIWLADKLVAGFRFNGGFWEQIGWAMLTAFFVSAFRMVARFILIKLKWIQPRK